MRAKDLMSSPVVAVRPDTPVKQAARLLVTHGYTALPVVDGEDNVLGILTEADLVRGRILPDPRALIADNPPPPAEPAASLVAGSMTADPVMVAPTTDAAAITKLMLDRHLRALPVVDGGRLVGIVTRQDLLRTIARDDADIAGDIRHRLTIACRQQWTVDVVDGVVTLAAAENADPTDRHVAQVVAAALPGVLEVHLVDQSAATWP
jgi:CBS-domain-containing membrane protein